MAGKLNWKVILIKDGGIDELIRNSYYEQWISIYKMIIYDVVE